MPARRHTNDHAVGAGTFAPAPAQRVTPTGTIDRRTGRTLRRNMPITRDQAADIAGGAVTSERPRQPCTGARPFLQGWVPALRSAISKTRRSGVTRVWPRRPEAGFVARSDPPGCTQPSKQRRRLLASASARWHGRSIAASERAQSIAHHGLRRPTWRDRGERPLRQTRPNRGGTRSLTRRRRPARPAARRTVHQTEHPAVLHRDHASVHSPSLNGQMTPTTTVGGRQPGETIALTGSAAAGAHRRTVVQRTKTEQSGSPLLSGEEETRAPTGVAEFGRKGPARWRDSCRREAASSVLVTMIVSALAGASVPSAPTSAQRLVALMLWRRQGVPAGRMHCDGCESG